MRRCAKCGLTKSTNEFYRSGVYWQSYCKPCSAASRKEHYHKNPRLYYHYQAKYKFGISKEDYDIMFASQDGNCASCGYELQGRTAVDHDKKTGVICGLLCLNCNLAAGQMWHNPELIRLLADYCERTRGT